MFRVYTIFGENLTPLADFNDIEEAMNYAEYKYNKLGYNYIRIENELNKIVVEYER